MPRPKLKRQPELHVKVLRQIATSLDHVADQLATECARYAVLPIHSKERQQVLTNRQECLQRYERLAGELIYQAFELGGFKDQQRISTIIGRTQRGCFEPLCFGIKPQDGVDLTWKLSQHGRAWVYTTVMRFLSQRLRHTIDDVARTDRCDAGEHV